MGSGPVTRSQANASTRELHPRAAKRKASISMEHGEGQRKPAKLTKAELSHAEAVDFSQNAGLPAEQSTVKAANAASRTGRNVDPVPDHVKKRLEGQHLK